mgnify:CR=1 FL=1
MGERGTRRRASIAARIAALDPAGADGFRARGDEVKAALRALHERIERIEAAYRSSHPESES